VSINQARRLQKTSTLAERKLWSALRSRQVCDLKFRRQEPIGSRIVDFYCAEAKLAIELDGSGHLRHFNETADLDKEMDLYEKGIRVLRFTNDAVLSNLDGVIEEILYAVDPEKIILGNFTETYIALTSILSSRLPSASVPIGSRVALVDERGRSYLKQI